MKKSTIKTMEEWLDRRFTMAEQRDAEMGNTDGTEFLSNNPDYIYYKGALEMLQCAGFCWKRNVLGKHTLFTP